MIDPSAAPAPRPSRRGALLAILTAAIAPALPGCAIFSQIAGAIPQIQPPKYKNLAGQSVTVMVWAEDQGIKIDNPRIQLDLAQMILAQLQQSQTKDKPEQLKLTRFPVLAASVVRFQEDHPELAGESIDKVAPMLGTSRVIYVEIRTFQTRSEASNDLYRGVISGSVSVVEVNNGIGRVAPVDETLRVTFPRTSPDEGLPNIGDFVIYNGTLQGFAEEIAKLFVPHADDPDSPYRSSADAPTA